MVSMYKKIYAVVYSCTTSDQIRVAIKFVNRARVCDRISHAQLLAWLSIIRHRLNDMHQDTCFQCDCKVDWLAPDGRCRKCTGFTPEEVAGESPILGD